MHNVKIISLKEPFTDEFNGVLLCKLHVIYYCSNIWSKLASKNALGPI